MFQWKQWNFRISIECGGGFEPKSNSFVLILYKQLYLNVFLIIKYSINIYFFIIFLLESIIIFFSLLFICKY